MKLKQRRVKFTKVKIVLETSKEAGMLWDIVEKACANVALTKEEKELCIAISNEFSHSAQGL